MTILYTEQAKRNLRARRSASEQAEVAREAQRLEHETNGRARDEERCRRAAEADRVERELGLARIVVTAFGKGFTFMSGHRDHVLRQITLEGIRRLTQLAALDHAERIVRARNHALRGTVAHAEPPVDINALLEDDKVLRPCAARGLVTVEDLR